MASAGRISLQVLNCSGVYSMPWGRIQDISIFSGKAFCSNPSERNAGGVVYNGLWNVNIASLGALGVRVRDRNGGWHGQAEP
jgi:hypothetical protein